MVNKIQFEEDPGLTGKIKMADLLRPASAIERWFTENTKVSPHVLRVVLVYISLLFFLAAVMIFGVAYYMLFIQNS